MNFQERLKYAGLTGNEAKLYLLLLEYGSQSANDLAKKASMDRTLSYTVLNNLLEKGLVSHLIKSKKKLFTASDPSSLLIPIQTKEMAVKELISELSSIQKKTDLSFDIQVFDGRESLRKVYSLFLEHKKILSFGATGKAYDYLYESPALTKELISSGLEGKIITSRKYKDHPMAKIKSISVRYFDFDSDATTTILGDYVIIHKIGEKPFVILIKNKSIAKTYSDVFNNLWNNANKK